MSDFAEDINVPTNNCISREEVLRAIITAGEVEPDLGYTHLHKVIENLPFVQSETCEGCKHLGKWENEVEYGYPSPCICCKRRVRDNYEI